MTTFDTKIATVEQLEQLEQASGVQYKAEIDARIAAYSEEEQKRLIHRVDMRLIPALGAIFATELMDRTNLGLAAIAGMIGDLDLIGTRYSICALTLFVTYVVMQPIATVLARKIGPQLFLPSTTMLLGVTTICCGFVKLWGELVFLRLLTGVFEAAFFPSCAYLLSAWYCRYELQKRNTAFYLIAMVAQAFSGILAYGFAQLKNHGSGPVWWGQHYGPSVENPNITPGILPGIAGWRWIFIFQGLVTCTIALVGYVYIVDFPERPIQSWAPKFLTPDEAQYFVARIEQDRQDAVLEPFHLGQYLKGAMDLKVWGYASMFGLNSVCTYAIAFFLPIILQDGMGFSTAASQCLTTPPYIFAATLMALYAWLGDKYQIRSPFIIADCLLLLIGLSLLGFATDVGARYFGVFLAVGGSNSNIPVLLTWQANNIRGQWKRALCSATLVAGGGIGGIVGTLVFRTQDKPSYIPGIMTTMIAAGLILAICLLMNLKFWVANRRIENGGKVIANLLGFKYTF